MTEPHRVRKVVSTVLPTAHGTFQMHGYAVEPGREHVALVLGDLAHAGSNGDVPLVRVHSECLTGDAFDPCAATVASSSTPRCGRSAARVWAW